MTQSPGDAEALLESSWASRGRRLGGRELRAEVLVTAAFLVAAAALAVLSGDHRVEHGVVVGLLVVAYAVASRVEFPIGAGYVVPTQLFLPPLLVLAAPADVPLLVCAALALGVVGSTVAGRSGLDRLAVCGGDAWHAVGPAAVFIAAGAPEAGDAPWWLWVAAFVAQLPLEVASTTIRERLAHDIPAALQLRVMAQVWAVDAMLLPAGVATAFATTSAPAAPLLLLGITVLFFVLARDRDRRIAQAQARLEALRRERERLRIAVQRIGEAFASRLDLEALLRVTMRASVDALDADAGRVSITHGLGGGLRRTVAHREAGCAAALAAAERTAFDTRAPAEAMVNGAWALARPIGPPGEPAGIVSVARGHAAFTPADRELLDHLCDQACVAASHAEKHATLHRQALTDELTGLANHRRLQEVLAAAVTRFRAGAGPVGLVLLDIDDFKAINDRHGHLLGDRVLQSLGACLAELCGEEHEAARYGGEELAVVVRGDLAAAEALAERVRAAIEQVEVVAPTGEPLAITASCGVAALRDRAEDAAALLDAADAALYRAKRSGKNCVRVATAPRLTAVAG